MPPELDLTNIGKLGLHKQGHLLRSVSETRSALLRRLSLLRHMVDALHSVTAAVRLLPATSRIYSRDRPSLCCHVTQCHPAEPVSGLLYRHLLPGRPYPPHANCGFDELRSIQSNTAAECHPSPDSGLRWRRHGVVLRFATHR